ncbi:response regulator [Maridesulfovibrio hydrothermalis]|uniref:Sensory/regulatory protein RpfC n=1 Tax=Maridesulfovibrio hydrothermalis AM13 = DSM 14728 TaxID=1121451 RepID=L0RG16_9BACT|nr:response regulator [Maridesulfovibrio hydrothermalis]CCO25155.1 Multi-sensor hybrid histidine kinase [Maridesulfovibrio hydrothermalis AM13 = DSM 14728]
MGSSHILVVEDSLTQAVKLEFFLFERGFQISLASNGERALGILAEKDIDLVISDVIMPGMDGYELCEKIRENPQYKSVPVILLTSLSDPGDIIKGLKSGATNFVTKPYDEGFLYSRIQSVLRPNSFEADQSVVQEVNFEFHGEQHLLKADFSQVFHLLLATYENTLLQSRQLDSAHRKLVSREEQLSSVLASMSAKIAVLDPELNIIAANESWRDLFVPGRSEAEIEGLDFSEAVSTSGCLSKSLDTLIAGVRSVIKGESRKFYYEYSLEGKGSGETLWYMLEVTPMRGKSGGAVASFIEITERKNMERELIEARDAAEKANRFKSRFLASMSHEIRTPLNAVIGMTDLTLRSELNSEQTDSLEIVRLSADQLLTLINDILDLSKVEARMLKLENNDFSLSEALYAVIKSMEPQAREKGLVLSMDLDEEAPEVVCGDKGRLKQILYNLVGNSLKFTEHGGIFVQVSTLDCQAHSGEVVLQIAVRDTGIGIPEDKQAVIFESFRQADDSTTRKFGGSGLGLAISRELVEMMGGEISVRSSEGYGSVFTFQVVLQPGDPAKLITEHWENGGGSQASDNSVFRILLVEDNPINVKVATCMLKKMGHVIEVAGNGVEAISTLSKLTVDLILMDLEMPEMDGFEASRNIRMGMAGEDKKDIPIIAMSAHAMAGVKDKCSKSGMNNYIAKPVQYADLKQVILATLKDSCSVSKGNKQNEVLDEIVLDRSKANDMYHGDESLYGELCTMFLSDVENDIKSFSDAYSRDDRKTARRVVHTLKSSCAAICAPYAQNVAVSLEKALLKGDAEAVKTCLDEFMLESQRIRTELAGAS